MLGVKLRGFGITLDILTCTWISHCLHLKRQHRMTSPLSALAFDAFSCSELKQMESLILLASPDISPTTQNQARQLFTPYSSVFYSTWHATVCLRLIRTPMLDSQSVSASCCPTANTVNIHEREYLTQFVFEIYYYKGRSFRSQVVYFANTCQPRLP